MFPVTPGRPSLIAMIHVGAMPGTPQAREPVATLARQACAEAAMLTQGGVDAILLENMHDVPYLNRRVGAEIVAGMTVVCAAVRQSTTLPLGVQILAGANRAALAVAHACGMQFVRCEGFVFSHVADEGLMPTADAGRLLRYRRAIGAGSIALMADIKKKHSAHAITSDVDIAETARAAEFFGADGVIVTGAATGHAADPAEVAAVRGATALPLIVGSGITPENIATVGPHCNAVIVGSWLKLDGHWRNGPDAQRVRRMVDAVRSV